MGWTSFYISQADKSADVINRELTSSSTDGASWSVVDHTMRGSVFYGIMCRSQPDPARRAAGTPENMFYGIVVLTERDSSDGSVEFRFKEMDETCGPCYYDMPARMLNFLDINAPHPGGYGEHWRKQCRARIEHKKELRKIKKA